VALVGTLQTENLGIERVIGNVLANPHIRLLLVCGAALYAVTSARARVLRTGARCRPRGGMGVDAHGRRRRGTRRNA
jgi:tetrahydromethanopterin S-methyltransferase subunit A